MAFYLLFSPTLALCANQRPDQQRDANKRGHQSDRKLARIERVASQPVGEGHNAGGEQRGGVELRQRAFDTGFTRQMRPEQANKRHRANQQRGEPGHQRCPSAAAPANDETAA